MVAIILKKIGMALLRAALVILAYALMGAGKILEYLLMGLAWVGKFVEVDLIEAGSEPEGGQDFSEKFTQGEIEDLAKSVEAGETIQGIEARLGVSYRQARKIHKAAKNPVTINHYSWENRLARE